MTPETPVIIVQDNDGNAITDLSIPEGGEVSYQVKLGTRILIDITLYVEASDPSNNVGTRYKNQDPDITLKDGQLNGLQVKLTFTPENWDTAQTVTLVAAEDSDAVHGMRDMIHSARVGYSPELQGLTVTEIDNDTVAPPAAPTGLTAAAEHKRAAITWNDPSDASITGYEYALQQVGNDQGAWITIRDSDADTTYHLIRNLTNGTAYVIHLRVLNAGGASAAAQAGVTPETPTLIVQDDNGNAITDLSIPEGGEVSYQVKLGTRILIDITLYVEASDPSNNVGTRYKNQDPDITLKDGQLNGLQVKLTFTPENWDTAQTVTLVAAEDSDAVHGMRDMIHSARVGYSPELQGLTVTEIDNDTVAPPAAPTGLTAAAEHKRAAITWNDPSDASITGYEYALQQVGNDRGAWITIRDSDADTTYHLIRNLTNGTAYTIHLRALNAGGASTARRPA